MDLNALMSTLLSGETVADMSRATGASAADVQSVLSSALPQLLTGAQAQANDAATAEGFLGALAQHAQDDTSDVTAFLQNVDTKDGEKIVHHLLGADQTAATQAAARKAGLSVGNTAQILAMAAPLLMSLLGQQTQATQQNTTTVGISSLMGALLGGTGGTGVDMSSLITGLLGGTTATQQTPSAGNLLGSLLGATTQTAAATTTTSTGKKKKKPASSASTTSGKKKPSASATSGKKKPASSAKKEESADLLGGLGDILGGLLK